MHPRSDASRGVDDHRDRRFLGLRRVVGDEVTEDPGRRAGHGAQDRGVLGVHDQQGVQRGDLDHRSSSCWRREPGELRDAGVEQEALEPEDARGRAASRRARPGSPARRLPRSRRRRGTGPGRPRCFTSSAGYVGGRRDAVQRHVDDGGDAAGERRPGWPLANPSHSVRPGSLTCTWVSTSPGISTSSSASSTTSGRAGLDVVRRHLDDDAVTDPHGDRDLARADDATAGAKKTLSCHSQLPR